MLRAAAGLALLCILLRGFIPSGYMPDLDRSREHWFALVLCAGAGPMPMAMHGASADLAVDAHTHTHTPSDTDGDAGNLHRDTMMHAGQDCPFAVAALQPFVGGVPVISTLTVPMHVARRASVPRTQHILPAPRAPPLGSRAPPSITV